MNPLLVALVACVPGIVTWWSGRGLVRNTADPLLPELLMARRQRLAVWFATSLAALIMAAGVHAFWGVPLVAFAWLAGRYPLSRMLFGETAGLGRYVWVGTKSLAGGLGFWVLLVWTPAIVLAIDARLWPVSLLLGALLVLWDHTYSRVWLRLHDAAPLRSAELEPHLATIVSRAGMTPPELYRIGAEGTRIVNAVALPSLRRPAIALGNALLELLEPDEVAAIYAHELSHIEQFGPRVLRRLRGVNWLLIALAVVVPLVTRWLAAPYARWVIWLWAIVVLLALLLRALKSQQRETESDLRAAALCGDADAVARALIKVHLHAFIPRRWPVDMERGASHPSLARRIQALRGDGVGAVDSLGAPAVLPTARDGSVVAFDDARAWWFDGVPDDSPRELHALRARASSTRSVAWSDLTELRVATKGAERTLLAVHRNGDRWSVPLSSSQVGPVQNALDRVDVRLQRELGKRSPPSTPLMAAAALVTIAVSGQLGILLVPVLLAFFRPSTAALAALGAMTLARAGFGFALQEGSWIPGRPALAFGAMALVGAIALGMTWRHVRASRRDGVKLTSYVLGFATACVLAVVVMAIGSLPLSHVTEIALLPSLAVAMLGVGAALLIGSTRPARWSGATVIAVAIAVAVPPIAASAAADYGELANGTSNATEIGRVQLGTAGGLRLSPSGARFIVQQHGVVEWTEPVLARPVRHLVGALHGPRHEIDAASVEFLDDDHVVVLRASARSLELRLEHADSGATAAPLYSLELPALYDPRLVVSPADGTWTVLGEDPATDSLVVLSGTARPEEPRSHRLAPLDSFAAIDYLPFGGGETLIVPAFNARQSATGLMLTLLPFGIHAQEVELWELTREGRRRIGSLPGMPRCGAPDGGHALCVIRDHNRSRMWSLNSSGEILRLRPLPLEPGAFEAIGPGSRLTVPDRAGRVRDLDVRSGQLTDIQLPRRSAAMFDARRAKDRLAILEYDGGATQLVIFSVAR